MDIRSKIQVMEAFERGEEIECATAGYDTCWHYVKTPSWNWKETDYRIKPKPKQVVGIEKWLMSGEFDGYYILEATHEHMLDYTECSKVKLLDTYEVEL